ARRRDLWRRLLPQLRGARHPHPRTECRRLVLLLAVGVLDLAAFAAAIADDRRLPSLGDYARNRALRIVPAFWAAFTLTLIAYHAKAGSLGDVISVYGFAQVWHFSLILAYLDHGWTTNIEVLFYVGLPLAAVALWA